MDSHSVSSNEIILHTIFKELPLLDLVRVQRVCTLWKRISENVLKQRPQEMKVEIFTGVRDGRFVGDRTEHFYDTDFFEWRKKLTILPDIALVCMNRYDGDIEGDVLPEMFPPKCRTFVFNEVRREGFVAADPKCMTIGEREMDVTLLVGYCSMILLPNMADKVSIEFKTIDRGANRQEKSEILTSLKNELKNPDMKFLFLFSTSEDHILALRTDLKSAMPRGVYVSGGVAERCGFVDLDLQYRDHAQVPCFEQEFAAILIKGKDVRATCLYIYDDYETMEEINEEFCRLKRGVESFFPSCSNHLEKCSDMGYCSSCNSQLLAFAVTYDDYIFDNMEPQYDGSRGFYLLREAFHRFFPKVPVYGRFFESMLDESVFPASPRQLTQGDIDVLVTTFTIVVLR